MVVGSLGRDGGGPRGTQTDQKVKENLPPAAACGPGWTLAMVLHSNSIAIDEDNEYDDEDSDSWKFFDGKNH